MALTQREAFARTMEHMCRHDGDGGHGYSQSARWGDGTWETVGLGDGVSVRIANGDRDCSSGIISALRAVGIDTGGASYTGNMRAEIVGHNPGLFAWSQRIARRGDIYLNERHHTAMCTSADPDMLAQFSISENGTISGRKGDQTGRESNIRPYYSYPWDGKIVWLNDGKLIGDSAPAPAPAPAPEPAQHGGIAVDGWWGSATTRALQAHFGTPQDGVVSSQWTGRRGILKACTSGWEWVGSPHGSTVVAAMQRALGVEADGIIGPATVNALERHYGYGADGHLDGPSNTVRRMQEALNGGRF